MTAKRAGLRGAERRHLFDQGVPDAGHPFQVVGGIVEIIDGDRGSGEFQLVHDYLEPQFGHLMNGHEEQHIGRVGIGAAAIRRQQSADRC